MRTHTNGFKNQIKLLGREIDSKITYIDGSEQIELGASDLNSITPSFSTTLLKSVMKCLEIDCNQEIPVGTIFNYQFGLKVNGEYEYIDFGNYVVKEVEIKEDTNSYLIKAYDKMLYSMKDYENLGVTYPITIRNYIIALATRLGLTFANATDTFCNYNRQIQKELFLDENGNSLDYTYRDVLDQLSEVVGGYLCINEDDELEIRYVNETNDTINEKYLKNINVKFGEKFGPVNSIVLSRASEADNVFLRDEESVTQNGLCEIKIKENQFMNFNDRSDYLEDLLDQLDGLEFYINDFDSTGVVYYELGDKYNVSIDGETYDCLMLNDTIEITQGLSESIYNDMPEETNTDYTKADKTDRKVNQTYIIADKQKGEIEALSSKTTVIENKTNDMYIKEDIDLMILRAEDGITNTFSNAGGNNIFRNTGLFFENDGNDSQTNPYEFWNGVVVRDKEELAVNQNCLKLQNTTVYQEQIVPNGTYTISFKYKNINDTINTKVIINDEETILSETIDTEFVKTINTTSQHINVKFVCDVDNGCEIYDLMVNKGETKLAYSQNQNEITTNTVNISKGIEITSSQTNTKFRADSDGVRVLNKDSNEEKAKFIDTGMEISEAEIKDKARIVKTIWQEVGEHTWITRL